MAMDAKEIAVNAAVDALAVAWDDLIDGLAAGAQLTICFCRSSDNGVALSNGGPPSLDDAGTSAQLTKYTYTIPAGTSSTTSMLYFIADLHKATGGVPLFWKVTDENDLITSA